MPRSDIIKYHHHLIKLNQIVYSFVISFEKIISKFLITKILSYHFLNFHILQFKFIIYITIKA